MSTLKKIMMTAVSASTLFALTGCQTTSQANEAQAQADADIAAAQAETEAAKVAGEEALAQARAEAAEAMAQVEAEKAELQAKLDEASAQLAQKVAAAQAIPGSTMTQDGKLLFTAEGQSVALAEEGAMGVTKARMAAETIAKANLLEVLKGALITSSVSVGDMMFESQAVSTSVNGWLGGVVLETSTSGTEESRLPDSEPSDQIVTTVATLEISQEAWKNLQDYVE